ncbi:hypothetical protein CHGG_10607 [Chaetomium globosum CBS 148.51]|uniref:Peptidase M13 C-terminal domain-containing protein n=1 Tax=Chaetomium globosum (strain ATCC 6205 / CBS 148.51 / DSM 1962 / NBRC 6347 / NRRL 1970) TaxID=306901 RepID=Q2GN47_CHAGB|nr:uncharacterized protein CHGG_10607 [Chaetomium globosum CBS 148.51]EAQ84203.1 hypothetical protein CHGG_10607 [Chaetomium globosum CBS 148.51]
MGQWQSSPVCTTPACVHGASYVLQNMAPNWEEMDPCTEFDKMVCYGAYEHNGDDSGTFPVVQKRTARILKKIMESSSHAEAAGFKSTLLVARNNIEESNFDMLRTAYQSCMDTDAIAAAGIKPLNDLIVSVNKTWPVPPTDLETSLGSRDIDGLREAALLLAQYDIPVFYSACSGRGEPVMPDFLDAVYLQNNLTSYFDEAKMKAYSGMLRDVFRISYPNLNNKTATALGAAVVGFEIDLVTEGLRYQESLGPGADSINTIKNVTLAEIDEAAPVFGFGKLVIGLTPTGKAPARILVNSPDFWPGYSNLVANHSRAAVQGFMMWTAINTVGKYIGDPDLQALLGVSPSPKVERWETCIDEIDKMARHIKDHYFISATYPELTLQAADKMTTNVKAEFRKRLEGFKWMSASSRKRALQKVDNMVQNIGYPRSNPDLRSADSIASYYTGLNFTSSYFSNVLSSLRFKTTKQYAKVTQKPNRNEYDNVAEVNAFYDPTSNAITIPAGISQLPFFHYHLPDYALYGGLGTIIGHEITHGFDNNGRQWSEDAEFEVWWDNSTIAEFEARSQCFVDQYSAFEVDVPGGKAHVDGLQTLGENLADAGGMRSAYAAWEEQRKAMPATWNQELPGLEKFTAEQLFFVYSANIWCNTRTPAEMARILPLDVHSPSMVRIQGMAENSDDFRKAFKCKKKEAKCELL